MSEGLYRQNQTVARLFGPGTRIAGTAGSARGPGHIEIRIDGRTIGTGPTFASALQDVTARTREAVR